jgi:hypothetical protein
MHGPDEMPSQIEHVVDCSEDCHESLGMLN